MSSRVVYTTTSSAFFSSGVKGAIAALALVSCSGYVHAQAGTALVRHAPALNGTVDGSVQQMTAESVTLNGNTIVTGDLFVPGTPVVILDGNPPFGGTLDGTGAAAPANYRITLKDDAALRHVVRRTEPFALPAVSPVPAPTGTRRVTVTASGQSAGDWATLRDLTLKGSVGSYIVPPGTYGEFMLTHGGNENDNKGNDNHGGGDHHDEPPAVLNSFTLGIAGATQPAVYYFQKLSVQSRTELRVAGPVVIVLAKGLTIQGSTGAIAHPAWLTLKLAKDDLTIDEHVSFYGYVIAPSGKVTLRDQSLLVGGLTCDRLAVDDDTMLRLVNLPPATALTAPASGTVVTAPATVTLQATASDRDGIVTKVEFFSGATKLGESTTAPYQFTWPSVAAGNYSLTTMATDNSGGTTVSSAVAIIVNAPPTVSLSAPVDNSLFVAPASITLQAVANDTDDSVARVEFFNGTSLLGSVTNAPYRFNWTGVGSGIYMLTAAAIDSRGVATLSAPVSILVDAAPTVSLTSPGAGAVFSAPASITLGAAAADADGTVAKVEFFAGSAKLGAATTAPYQFQWTGVVAGNYSLTAAATDNLGVTAISAEVGIIVAAPPSVTLTGPTGGALASPASVSLTAAATASHGTIARVEFYRGAALVGTLTSPSVTGTSNYTFTDSSLAPGTYAYKVRTYDNLGAFTDSSPVTVTVLAGLPFLANFELSEGYSPGSLDGQLGWVVAQGAAVVTGAGFYSGTQSVSLSPASPPALIAQTFAPAAGESVVFADFFTKPVADAAIGAATGFEVGDARFALLLDGGGRGMLQAFNGDGLGGGQWTPTQFGVPLDQNNQSQNFLRLTARLDFTRKIWDLYANGAMVAADLGFRANTSTHLDLFALQGHAVGTTFLDDFLAAADNPLFADVNGNGIDDTWETAHGLSLANYNRNSAPSGNGITVLQAYLRGTDPNDFYQGQAPRLSITGGNNQTAPAGQFNPLAFGVLVQNAAGTAPLAHAPVSFSVTQGGGLLAPDNSGPAAPTASLTIRTGTDGAAQLFYQQPGTPATPSQIGAAAGAAQVVFQTNSASVDYYQGVSPTFTSLQDPSGVLGSDGALSVIVQDSQGLPLVNAPVVFTAKAGGHLLSATAGGTGSTAVEVTTDAQGLARAYVVVPGP